MKIIVLGGGPGGLYSALLLKKVNPAHRITVIERNPANATYGWGILFSDRTLASLREADPKSYSDITSHFVLWDAIDVRYRDEVVRSGGHVFAGMARMTLLRILQNRCAEVGVQLIFGNEITDLSPLGDYDLLIAADGINSLVRKIYSEAFGPRLVFEKAKFVWLGSNKVFDSFTYLFRENEHGLFQVHAYPFDGTTSTFIVECDEESWLRAGLDQATEAGTIAYCEKVFGRDLKGRSLLSNKSLWINFVTVTNKTWRHNNMVLLGDAAHTAHFTIGSGTKMAMEDAIALAHAFEQPSDIETALTEYELARRPIVEALQRAAAESRTYFENTRRYLHFEPMQFTFHLMTRSGRITYDNLRIRDSQFVDAVDRRFLESTLGTSACSARIRVAPPPMFVPLRLRGITLANRAVSCAISTGSALDGLPGDRHAGELSQSAPAGVGMVLTEPAAVSPEGRITPGCAGMYREEHAAAWAAIVENVHRRSPAKIGIQLGHAGRRGSTRPRREGLDRPLREGNWPLLAPSPLAYTPFSQVPKEMDQAEMEKVRGDFVRAARMAHDAGFDLVQLHLAQGYLLASFLSPLTNRRTDGYGGPLANRMSFPLEVFDAVRAVWPSDKPVSVALLATDWATGGFAVEDAVVVAKALQARGCDLVTVLAGQTIPDAEPVYGPGFLVPYSDRVRNEAPIATMTAGQITTTDQVNTILAAGRADLCILDPTQ